MAVTSPLSSMRLSTGEEKADFSASSQRPNVDSGGTRKRDPLVSCAAYSFAKRSSPCAREVAESVEVTKELAFALESPPSS